MYALTCITPYAYKELLTDGIKTMELRSSHNINSLVNVKEGDYIFVTYKTTEDLNKKTEGIIARVKYISLQKKRQSFEYDEFEVTTARVQLMLIRTAKLMDVIKQEIGKEVSVEIEKIMYYKIS
ncbi:MAG: DUF473 family protein [Candidatus Methanofastidiosia archaeon]